MTMPFQITGDQYDLISFQERTFFYEVPCCFVPFFIHSLPTFSQPLFVFNFKKFKNQFSIAHQSFHLPKEWYGVNERMNFKDFSRPNNKIKFFSFKDFFKDDF